MIQVQKVNDKNHDIFYRLSQEYESEFSVITKKFPDADGRFDITDQVPGKYDAWLAYHDDQPIGFAVRDLSRERRDVAEFYIAPKFRKSHLGEQLAAHLFDWYQGPWQVRQIIGAEYARDFWVSVIKRYTHNSFSNTIEDDPEWGRVYVQKFQSVNSEKPR